MLRIFEKYSKIISSFRVTRFEQFGNLFKLRAEAQLIDGSKLYIRETIIYSTKRKYSYHWQNTSGELITRWDNAPDWDVETFPHHKHSGDKKQAKPSYERTLEQVLAVIAEKMKKP